MVSKDAKTVQVGDVVTVFEENRKRGDWKMGVVESLIKGKDEVVRGANIRVIAKGKPLRMSRPVQTLYPLEVQSETFQGGELQRHAKENPAPLKRNPTRTAALDVRWKTNSMLDS